MEAQAFERALRTFARRTPFQPFEVELASGTRLQIDHPEALTFRGVVAVHVARDHEITLFDNTTVSKIATMNDANAAK
jgi:hypothetical protein